MLPTMSSVAAADLFSECVSLDQPFFYQLYVRSREHLHGGGRHRAASVHFPHGTASYHRQPIIIGRRRRRSFTADVILISASSLFAHSSLLARPQVHPDREICKEMVQAAEASGCKVLFITCDTPTLGRRDRDRRNKIDTSVSGPGIESRMTLR